MKTENTLLERSKRSTRKFYETHSYHELECYCEVEPAELGTEGTPADNGYMTVLSVKLDDLDITNKLTEEYLSSLDKQEDLSAIDSYIYDLNVTLKDIEQEFNLNLLNEY